VCGRASERTIIGLIITESATGIVTTFDICRFQGVTALALTTINIAASLACVFVDILFRD
jgi:hypothetical protein